VTLRLKIAFSLNTLVSIAFIASAFRYLLSSQIMPYHLEVIGRSWSDFDPRLQMMLLGLLRLGGIGQLSAGVAIGIFTLIPFRHGERWAYWAIPLTGLLWCVPIFYGAHALHSSTGAGTPWKAVMILSLVLVAAYLLTLRSSQRAEPQRVGKKATPA
jgi:hypothetical protein